MRGLMRVTLPPALALGAAAVLSLPAAAEAAEQDRVRWLGEMRTIAVHAPPAGGEQPLLLVLGEPGRAARYALGSWRELADREGFVVASVASRGADHWRAPHDGPGLLRAVVRQVGQSHRIDPRRTYLFGYGYASGFAIAMGVLQPRYFAAVGSFGGNPRLEGLSQHEPPDRALPVRIFYSKRELQFDVDALKEGATYLRGLGVEVEVAQLGAVTDFERRGSRAAGRIWEALSAHTLSEPGRYRSTPYDR